MFSDTIVSNIVRQCCKFAKTLGTDTTSRVIYELIETLVAESRKRDRIRQAVREITSFIIINGSAVILILTFDALFDLDLGLDTFILNDCPRFLCRAGFLHRLQFSQSRRPEPPNKHYY